MPRPDRPALAASLASIALALAVALALAGLAGSGALPGIPVAAAAPALPPKPATAPDHVSGPLLFRLGDVVFDGPVVLVREATDCEPELVVWLVFLDPAQEPEKLRDLAEGQRVTARGKLAQGGAWKYLIVSSVGPES